MGRRIKAGTDSVLTWPHHELAAQPQNVLLSHGRVFKAKTEGHIQGPGRQRGPLLC